MKGFRCVGLAALLLGLFAWSGVAQSYTVTPYAGYVLPRNGVQAITHAVGNPTSVIRDGAGGFYIASIVDFRIYRVTADGSLSVIAGNGTAGFSGDGGPAVSAGLNYPQALTVDTAGNLFIADTDNNRIRKVSTSGVISTVAGNGTRSFSGDGGPAVSAELTRPLGVAIDDAGNLFIADLLRIRKVTAGGVITTVAGNGLLGLGGEGDGGPAISAPIGSPREIAVDRAGNLFIVDYYNHRVRKVTQAGIISTVAGRGTATFSESGGGGFSGDGGPAVSAQLYSPESIAVDEAGNLFIADKLNHRIRKVNLAGFISTVVGSGIVGFSGDGGPAVSARLFYPESVTVDGAGNLFIADTQNQRIRHVSTSGIISTVAGNGTQSFSGDGGPAVSAQFAQPAGIALDRAGNLFIADDNNSRIRKVSTSGVITTVAGNGTQGFAGDGGRAVFAQLWHPMDVAVDRAGNLFIADLVNRRIRKVTPAGVISTVVGTVDGFGGDGGPAVSAGLDDPGRIVVDDTGNLFIVDSRNKRVRKVTLDGLIHTVAGNGTAGFSGDGGPAISAGLTPGGIAVDDVGNLFIADTFNNRVRKVTPDGLIITVAGNGTAGFSGDSGSASSAMLNGPRGVAVDDAGNLFIADNGRIREVSPTGIIRTVAGGSSGFIGGGRPATEVQITPSFIALDAAGNLYINDGNYILKMLRMAPPTNFMMVDRGGVSLLSSGMLSTASVGHASIQPDSGSTMPSGLAIFGFRQNNVLVTEAGVPVSPLVQSGRIYADVNGPVNTGVAIANPSSQAATVSFFFTDSNGNFGHGTTVIPANGQIAAFLDQPPFNGRSSLSGAFSFSSSVPIAVIALRGLTNERGEFLITTLPVADLSAGAAVGTLVFPHFADGNGWTTQIVLVNPGDSVLTGAVQFFDSSGRAASVGVNGQSNTSFTYSIPAGSSRTLPTSGTATSTVTGSVRVVPAVNSAVPSGVAIFSFRNGTTTVSEAGVPTLPAGSAFRLYAEASGDFSHGVVGSIQTGLAVANISSNAAAVTLELSKLDGSSNGLTGTLTVPANGQVATFLNEVPGFASLQTPFQGVLRVSSQVPISVVGLRGRYNERNDFLITTTPPVNEATVPSTAGLFFPHIVDSGGYTTQFILFSGQPGQSSSGTMQLFSQSGGALNLPLR